MIRSGIVPIDELCGGMQPRSMFVLTGGAGAGKTTLSLQFAHQGLISGEKIVLLSHGPGKALLDYAYRCGLDLRPAIREERLVLLRYRSDFAKRLARSGNADRPLDDIRGVLEQHRPRRIVIDTFAPLLEDGTSSPVAAASLADLLVSAQATTLLTYPDDLSERYDRRIEPLVQAAAGIFRITRDARGGRQLEIVTLRYAPALESAAADIGPPNLVGSLGVS